MRPRAESACRNTAHRVTMIATAERDRTRRGATVMLRILGSPKRLCNGMTRREMLVAGGLSLLGLGLSDYLRLSEAQAGSAQPRPRTFGRAKACILLYL